MNNDGPSSRGGEPAFPRDDARSVELTPELAEELLDAQAWREMLALCARSMKLAVALTDANGKLLGSCHNPQPVWSLAHAAQPKPPADSCPFCLDKTPQCSAARQAQRNKTVALARDQGGFAHLAIELSVEGRHLGTLLAGQVLDRYPELLPLQRLARDFGLSPQTIWDLARQQPPLSRANLTVYGELLATMSRTFLRDRYNAVMEARASRSIAALNRQLAAVNARLTQNAAELDRSNNYLQHLFDSTETATIFLDHELRIEKFTPSARKWFRLDCGDNGDRFEDLRGRFAELGLAEQLSDLPGAAAGGLVERVVDIVRAFPLGSSHGQEDRRELNLTAAEGKHYLLRLIPYRDSPGMSNGAVLSFIDVTALKNAEHLIEMEKLYAENIVATVPEPLLVLDGTFHVHSVNRSFYETFGTNPEETEGRLLYELGNGEWDIPELRSLFTDLLSQNQWVKDFEVERDFAHLGLRTMLLSARRIGDKDLMLLALRDVTERRRSVNALRKVNSDLKHFSYAAAHDLQEPLRTVIIYAQLLAQKYKGKLDAEGEEFIGSVMTAAQRTVALLKDLREYWLVSEGLEQRAAIDCEAVFEKTMQLLQVSVDSSGAVVTHDALPTVLADEVSLAMLFQNLLGNAIKYRRAAEAPHIHVAAFRAAGAWCFSVKDNGIGIKAEHLEEIAAPFKRLNGKEYPGTGIGLALCDKIVQRYAGRFWVESIFGQGSTFFFTIPDKA